MTSTLTPRRRIYYHGWNIVATCVLSQLMSIGVPINCFSLFLRDWGEQFDAPVSELALGMATFGVGCAICVPLAGIAADRLPVRLVMGGGLLGVAILHFVVGLANASWQIIMLYALFFPPAVACSAAVPAQALVSRWFVRRRGLAMGVTAFGLSLAGVILPPVITWLLPMLGWRLVWWLFGAVVGCLALPTVLCVLRERPDPIEGAAYIVGIDADVRETGVTTKRIFARRNFWIIVGAFASLQCSSSAVSVNLAPLLLERGFSLQTAGMMFSILGLSSLVSMLLVGLVADRVGSRLPLIFLAIATSAGAAVLGVAHTLEMLCTAVVLIGLTTGMWTRCCQFNANLSPLAAA